MTVREQLSKCRPQTPPRTPSNPLQPPPRPRRQDPPRSEALYARVDRIQESIRELSLRQFNARYPLRVRREMAREKKAAAKESETKKVDKDTGTDSNQPRRIALRALFHDLAADVATTETGPGLIDLLGEDLDGYVDEVVAALTDG